LHHSRAGTGLCTTGPEPATTEPVGPHRRRAEAGVRLCCSWPSGLQSGAGRCWVARDPVRGTPHFSQAPTVPTRLAIGHRRFTNAAAPARCGVDETGAALPGGLYQLVHDRGRWGR
jgi:hypothetical protein